MTIQDPDKRYRSTFSYRTEADSQLGVLFSFFNGSLTASVTQREGKTKAIAAMTAFWQPYALRAAGGAHQTIYEAAQHSIAMLHAHIEQIYRDFDGLQADSRQSPTSAQIKLEALLPRLEVVVEHLERLPKPLEGGAEQPIQQVADLSPEANLVETTGEGFCIDDMLLLGDLC
jgi:hypothetical protein